VDAVMNYHFNPEYRLNDEYLNHDMTRITSDNGQQVIGHSLEVLWMIMFEAIRKKDKTLFDTVAERLYRHIEVLWDDVYGGLLAGFVNVDKNIWSISKSLWLQEEALISCMCVIEHTGAQWAKDWFSKQYTYVRDKFPLKQYGFPLWIVYADRKITFERHYDRVENYHHPRHLMLNMLMLDRIIGRGGKVSGIFG